MKNDGPDNLKGRIEKAINEVRDEFKRRPMDFFVEHDFHHVFEKRVRASMRNQEVLVREFQIPGSRRRTDFVIVRNGYKIGVEFYFQKASNEWIQRLNVEGQVYLVKPQSLSPLKAKRHLVRDVYRLKDIRPDVSYFIEFYRIIIDTRVTSNRKDLANYKSRMHDILDYHDGPFNKKSTRSFQTPLFILWDGMTSDIKMFNEI